jgi:hypothetical protein
MSATRVIVDEFISRLDANADRFRCEVHGMRDLAPAEWMLAYRSAKACAEAGHAVAVARLLAGMEAIGAG